MLDLNNITILGGTGFIGSNLVFEYQNFQTILLFLQEIEKRIKNC